MSRATTRATTKVSDSVLVQTVELGYRVATVSEPTKCFAGFNDPPDFACVGRTINQVPDSRAAPLVPTAQLRTVEKLLGTERAGTALGRYLDTEVTELGRRPERRTAELRANVIDGIS